MLPSVTRPATRLRLGVFAISFIAIASLSCGGDNPVSPFRNVGVAEVRVFADSIIMDVADTLLLRAEARDGTGLLMTSVSPTWTSLDESVVRVDSRGVATGVSRGTTWLVARAASLTDTVAVRVLPSVIATTLGQDTLTIVTRDAPFEVSLTSVSDSGPRDGRYEVTVGNEEWMTAYVAPSGRALVVMALRDTGSAWVTVREAQGTRDSVLVHIRRRAATMSITGSGGGYVGRTARLTVAAADAGGFAITEGTIVWESSDVTKATVDTTGLVSFVSPGDVSVVARHSHGTSTRVPLLVEDMPKFAFFRDAVILGAGHRSEIQAVFASGPGVDSDITLTVLDTTVATAPPSTRYGGDGVFHIDGQRAGTTLVIASARLMRPDTMIVRVIPSHIEIVGRFNAEVQAQERMVVNATRVFGLVLRDSLGRAGAPVRSGTVNVSSSDSSVILVRPDLRTLTIAGAGPIMTEVRAVAVGPAWLRLDAGDFGADSVEIFVAPGASVAFRTGTVVIGAGQTNAERPVQLATTLEREHEATTFTLTQRRPDIARIPDTLAFPTNFLYRDVVIEGLARGTDTVIASAPGFLPDTLVVVVTTPRLVAPHTASGTIAAAPILLMMLADSTGVQHTPAGLRTLTASSSNNGVVTPINPARFPEGFRAPWPFTMTVHDTGTAVLTLTDTAGLMTPHNVIVTVGLDTTLTARASREEPPYTIGTRQRLPEDFLFISRGGSHAPDATDVTLRPSDPAVLRVSETVTLPPGGQHRLAQVVGGDREGTATVIASAHLYRNAMSPLIRVGRPRIRLLAPATMVRGATGYFVHAAPLDPLGRQRFVDDTVRFILESPDGAITIPRELTIVAGREWSDTMNIVGNLVGPTRLIVRDARAVPTPYAPDTIDVQVISPFLTLQGFELAMPQVGVRQSLPGIVLTRTHGLSSPVTVDVTHSNGRTVTSNALIIPAGLKSVSMPLVGARLGIDTIVVTADGYAPDTGRVLVTEGRFGVWGLPISMRVGDSVRVEIRTGVPTGDVRAVSEAITVDLVMENGLTASNGSQTLRSVTVRAGSWISTSFWIRASEVGTAHLSVSNLHYRPERFAIEVRAR
ncbi:MAG: hypothetical protein ACT4PJ_03750 [Gemmatimonadaceae bacterium]